MDGGQWRRAGNLDERSTTHAVAVVAPRTAVAPAEKRSLSHGTAPRTISVAGRPVWRDAERAAARLTQAERDTLTTLIRVPLATVTLLEQLGGLHGGAAIYRRLSQLRAAGLVAELRPLIQPRYSPGLLYVTDLGLAVMAASDWSNPVEIARRFRVRGSDLLGRLPGLPTLLASYRLLGALAMAGPGWPCLISWEQPFRRRLHVPTAKAPQGWSCRRTPRLHGMTGARPSYSSPTSARPTFGSIDRCFIRSMRFDGPSAMPRGSSSPPTAGGVEPGRRYSRTSPSTDERRPSDPGS